ncbi:uncharacterized protein LOC134273621 isoform X1 [Saccostrea cucullata]|uniref:uncharacterized protein LOC134273621 isoform X1 n=1 Tax=Saccostrea cuccullata TaxID=36930 RepID=UPI002ED55AA1
MTKKRKAMQEKSQLQSTKCQRMILKQERAIVQSSSEVLEGILYQSGIGHDADTDIESLPEAIPRGIFKSISFREGDIASFVTFDLETTDLTYELHSGATFSVYVTQRLPISSSVSREEKARNLPSLNPHISHGVMKMCTAENVAGFCLQLTHLKKIFELDGEEGLRNLFIASNSEGQPRVTNVKRILECFTKIGRLFCKELIFNYVL